MSRAQRDRPWRHSRAKGVVQAVVRVRLAIGGTLTTDGVQCMPRGFAPDGEPTGSRDGRDAPRGMPANGDVVARRWRSGDRRERTRLDARAIRREALGRRKRAEGRCGTPRSIASGGSSEIAAGRTGQRPLLMWSAPGVPHARYGSTSRRARQGKSVFAACPRRSDDAPFLEQELCARVRRTAERGIRASSGAAAAGVAEICSRSGRRCRDAPCRGRARGGGGASRSQRRETAAPGRYSPRLPRPTARRGSLYRRQHISSGTSSASPYSASRYANASFPHSTTTCTAPRWRARRGRTPARASLGDSGPAATVVSCTRKTAVIEDRDGGNRRPHVARSPPGEDRLRSAKRSICRHEALVVREAPSRLSSREPPRLPRRCPVSRRERRFEEQPDSGAGRYARGPAARSSSSLSRSGAER